MGNRQKGEVEFESGGKTYTLAFSINALCSLEEEMGMGVAEVGKLMQDPAKVRLSNARMMFRIGLSDHHPDIDTNQAGALMTALTLPKAMELMGNAFIAAFPEDGKANSRPQSPAARREK